MVRQELTILYQRHISNEFARSKIAEFEESISQERADKYKAIIDGKEDKDLSLEQREAIVRTRNEYHAKKMQMYEEHIKSREPLHFNANVFKNVKLVLSEEELRAEEDKVRALATFLKEHALPNLVKNYAKNEGTPSDSHALSEFFH